jgi:isopentenyl diphosphate isomerase/L-lactate dehydrogenase-like FMN-dependent dehydrogenase
MRFLAASPFAYGLHEAWAQESAPAALAQDVLSVLDFEALAKPKLPPAHWGYMASGVDDNLTLQANIAAFRNIQLRPRRLVDVSKLDASVELFGQRSASPIFMCLWAPRMFHADGGWRPRASKAKNTL